MNNIFKNDYFGKAYKTRDGRKALFIGDMQGKEVSLLTEENGFIFVDYDTGISLHHPSTIVSEWQEPIK